MKKLLIVGVFVFAAVGAVAARQFWPYKPFQPGGSPDFVSQPKFVSYWRLEGAGHGAGAAEYKTGWNVQTLYFRGSTRDKDGCWIGNVEPPHNWAPAPLEVCGPPAVTGR